VYIEGDPRFKKVRRATGHDLRLGSEGIHRISYGWKTRAYACLGRNASSKHPCNGIRRRRVPPAPALREVLLDDPARCTTMSWRISPGIRKSGLVHADMSEYNRLWWEGPHRCD